MYNCLCVDTKRFIVEVSGLVIYCFGVDDFSRFFKEYRSKTFGNIKINQSKSLRRKGFHGLEAFFLRYLVRFKYAFDYTFVFSLPGFSFGDRIGDILVSVWC